MMEKGKREKKIRNSNYYYYEEEEEDDDGVKGLTTEEAFDRLITALTGKLEVYRSTVGSNWSEILSSSLSTRSRHCVISWSSLLLLLGESIIIFTLYTTNFSPNWASLLPEGIGMLLIFALNLSLVIWENYKRVNELPAKLEIIINQLREIITSDLVWEEKNYPGLFVPISPCISLQWCYRDGKLVNLPWALLVQGDVIVIQPAQKILADCSLIDNPELVLKAGEIYSPKTEAGGHHPTGPIEPPRLHPPVPTREAILLTSPYLDMVDICLKEYLDRPPTYFNKERHTIVTRIIECVVLPLAIMTFVALCLVRMFYLPHWLGIRVAPWADITLLQPMTATFPLIPLSLPALWSLLMCIGNAKLWKGFQFCDFQKEDTLSSPGKGDKVILNEWKQYTKNFMDNINGIKDFFLGREETLHRSQKALHIFASLTAFSCVDKKGILSWPNPTADKIFFLRTVPGPSTEDNTKGSQRRKSSISMHRPSYTSIAEVLDITVDNNNELHFDDTQWEHYLANLKPLGLNILLNTCNPQTQETYSSFHSHISHEFLINKRKSGGHGLVIPVTARRCLCDVAAMMGFKDKATSVFSLEQKLCTYRHIDSEHMTHEQLSKAKVKFPFPHMMSVIVKEKLSHTLQLFSQGTGDVVTLTSDDFWDGRDLRPITEHERKLILDFYHSSSLGSISTAFGYRPVPATVNPCIASLYMELPPSRGLKSQAVREIDQQGNSDSFNSPFLNVRSCQASHISTDCLLDSHPEDEIRDVQGSLEMQTGQVFLGIVTMQYQACLDIVQLVEQLEQGCIRFVHFSKENELRSRLFSEKMGLESGWNCHIRLEANTTDKAMTEEISDNTTGDVVVSIDDEDQDIVCKNNRLGLKRSSCPKPGKTLSAEEAALLPRSSASVPEIAMLIKANSDEESKTEDSSGAQTIKELSINESVGFGFSSDEDEPSTVRVRFDESSLQADNEKAERPSSWVGSTSSVILSPDGYPEMYELVEHPTPLGIDLTNRAQLPVGIENIRPHLDNVDNVPLLVSLFTDCNADNTREMISIMQDYGEVTVVLGSGCSYGNRRLFLQADASVAVEPLYPQACHKHPAFEETKNGGPTPSDVVLLLMSLPCALSMKRRDCSLFYNLIAQARHFMNKCVRNSFQFWICANSAVTFLGLLSLLMLLPPLYSLGDAMWLTCVIIPIITLGLAFAIMNRVDITVMGIPSRKNQVIVDRRLLMYGFWCYGMKFIPSMVNVALMACFNLRWICEHLPNSTCSWVYPVTTKHQATVGENKLPRLTQCISTWSCENLGRLAYVQQFSIFFTVLYFVAISSCFVYRSKYLWVRNPVANKVWVATSVTVIFLQLLYWAVKVGASTNPSYHLLPPYSYIWGVLWIPVGMALNELIRRHEIKVNIRYEKRARLDFGTRLGMNSPI